MEIKLNPAVSVYKINQSNKKIFDNRKIKRFRGKIIHVENSPTMKTLITIEMARQIRSPFDILNETVTVLLE